jgi:LAGLIDADG endonuclease
MLAIKDFLFQLPGENISLNKDINLIGFYTHQSKITKAKPNIKIQITLLDYLQKCLVPFFDNLVWLTKKKLDYLDWKLILAVKFKGYHFKDEGGALLPALALASFPPLSSIGKRTGEDRASA